MSYRVEKNGWRYEFILDNARSSKAMICDTCEDDIEKRKLEINNVLEDNLNNTDCELPIVLIQLTIR